MPRLLYCLIGALFLTACADDRAGSAASEAAGGASGPGAAQPEYVLAPGPEDPPAEYREYPEWEARPEVQQARTQARAFWQRHAIGLEEDFAVVDVAEGRFAGSPDGLPQTAVLYRMSLSPSCCVRMGLAIIEGDRLVRNVAFDGAAQSLRAVPDLDGDGFDELVIGAGGGGQGYFATSIEVVSLGAGDAVREWGRLDTGESDCGALGEVNTTVRVVARPGPVFLAQPFSGSCDDEAMRAAGPLAPVELQPPLDRSQPGLEDSVGFVVLPST